MMARLASAVSESYNVVTEDANAINQNWRQYASTLAIEAQRGTFMFITAHDNEIINIDLNGMKKESQRVLRIYKDVNSAKEEYNELKSMKINIPKQLKEKQVARISDIFHSYGDAERIIGVECLNQNARIEQVSKLIDYVSKQLTIEIKSESERNHDEPALSQIRVKIFNLYVNDVRKVITSSSSYSFKAASTALEAILMVSHAIKTAH